MEKNETDLPNISYPFALLLLSTFIFLIYSNTFNAFWQFDDYPNILTNSNLHINILNLDSISKTFYAHPYDNSVLYRPIACFSLALNYYFNKFDVTGYHLVNITIHTIGAFLLFLTILNLLKSPNLKMKYQGNEFFIALLSATLWAINPIQTQAVTYIVQRMASLAGMFYIFGIYFYLKARLSNTVRMNYLFSFGCLCSFLLAIGSKENAATLPIALLLIEMTFFQNITIQKNKKLIIGLVVITLLIVIFVSFFIYMAGGGDFIILQGYNNRPFNLFERLLSSPRVLLFYLSQIFYSVPQRFAIQHDFIASTSFLEPWATLPALLTILFLICTGIFLIKKNPIISFSILFFFLNHIIESTILPLEIVFEHRNYIPSFFIFFPIAVYFKKGIDFYRLTSRLKYFVAISFGICLMFLIGNSTYIRNMAWATEKSLWEDALKKAPGIVGPYQKVAEYYQRHRDYDHALDLYQKALSLRTQNLQHSQIVSLTNIGVIYKKKHEYKKAIDYFKYVLKIDPNNKKALYNYASTLMDINELDEASKTADLLFQTPNNQIHYLNLKGFILIKQQKHIESLLYLRNALRKAPNNTDLLLNIGSALSYIGNYSQADLFFNRANELSPSNLTALLHLIENSIRSNNKPNLDKYTKKLLSSFNIFEINNILQGISNDNSSTLLSYKLLSPAIAEAISKASKKATTY